MDVPIFEHQLTYGVRVYQDQFVAQLGDMSQLSDALASSSFSAEWNVTDIDIALDKEITNRYFLI